MFETSESGNSMKLRVVEICLLRKTIRTYTMVMATVFGGMNLIKNISSPLPDVKPIP
jgi:hypothetical protein